PRDFKTPNYGMTRWADLFTNRQLVALTTFSDLVTEARERVLTDAFAADLPEGERLEHGGTAAAAYADAVATYLALSVSRATSTNSSLCRWRSDPSKESVNDTFARQALPMVWDYAEGNVFVPGPPSPLWGASFIAKVLDRVPERRAGTAVQTDA